MHLIYFIHEFHNFSWITEINELFHNILIYWDATVLVGLELGVVLGLGNHVAIATRGVIIWQGVENRHNTGPGHNYYSS